MRLFEIQQFLLPAPSAILTAFRDNFDRLVHIGWFTTKEALGGFATNGVNMTKLESYQIDGKFTATQFYADIEGHPDDKNVAHALEELEFFSKEVRILGVYPADTTFRSSQGEEE